MAHPAQARRWWIVTAVLVLVALGLVRVFGALLRLLGGG